MPMSRRITISGRNASRQPRPPRNVAVEGRLDPLFMTPRSSSRSSAEASTLSSTTRILAAGLPGSGRRIERRGDGDVPPTAWTAGQADGIRRLAASSAALGLHAAAVHLHQAFDERQADAESALGAPLGSSGPLAANRSRTRVSNAPGMPTPSSSDRDLDPAGRLRAVHGEPDAVARLGGVFRRVHQQIVEQVAAKTLRAMRAIDVEPHRLRRQVDREVVAQPFEERPTCVSSIRGTDHRWLPVRRGSLRDVRFCRA